MEDYQILKNSLKELLLKRKNGEITTREFYGGLLELLADLKDALVRENINEKQIKKQIPLILAFLESQINELETRTVS